MHAWDSVNFGGDSFALPVLDAVQSACPITPHLSIVNLPVTVIRPRLSKNLHSLTLSWETRDHLDQVALVGLCTHRAMQGVLLESGFYEIGRHF